MIEPSFGIGRILYSLFEHSYWVREDDEQKSVRAARRLFPCLTLFRTQVLSFKPNIAPIKCLVAPLSSRPETDALVEKIGGELRKSGIAYKVDDSGISIGRRYARADELGIPFDITVDFQSVKDETVTIRFRDLPRQQVRLPIAEVAALVSALVAGPMTWDDATAKYPLHTAQDLA